MQEPKETENSDLDNHLAEFVDRLLADEKPGKMDSENPDLYELQKTVVLIKQAFDASQMEKEGKKQTKYNVFERLEGTQEPQTEISLWQRIKERFSVGRFQPDRRLAFNIITAMAVLLLVVWLVSTPVKPLLTAAAGGQDMTTYFVVAVGILLAILLTWMLTNRK